MTKKNLDALNPTRDPGPAERAPLPLRAAPAPGLHPRRGDGGGGDPTVADERGPLPSAEAGIVAGDLRGGTDGAAVVASGGPWTPELPTASDARPDPDDPGSLRGAAAGHGRRSVFKPLA